MIRVAPTARLAHIKGSTADRNLVADRKIYKVFREIQDVFMKKDEITSEKLHEIVKTHAPNIKFAFCENETEGFIGGIQHIYKNNTTKSFDIELPFRHSKGRLVINPEQMDTLIHEITHFFDFITKPKMSARNNHQELWDKDIGFQIRCSTYSDFYDKHIYKRENAEKGFDKKALAKKFKKLFENTPASERIEILQDMRHGIYGEIRAYPRGALLEGEFEFMQRTKGAEHSEGFEEYKAQEMAKIEEKANHKIKNEYFFEEKMDFVNELLKTEINQVRAQQLKTAKIVTRPTL